MCIIHHLQECDHRHHESRINPLGLINDLFPAPASSNARNYTEWATQTTFINVEFFNSIFLRDTYLMIYDLSRWWPHYTPVLPDPMSPITRWHWMTTWHDHKQFTRTILRASHEISENQFLICCLLVTPILLSAKTKVKTSFFYQTPDLRKSLIELILQSTTIKLAACFNWLFLPSQ